MYVNFLDEKRQKLIMKTDHQFNTSEVENVYDKFTEDNTHQSLSESIGFCESYDKKIFWCIFFGSQCIC